MPPPILNPVTRDRHLVFASGTSGVRLHRPSWSLSTPLVGGMDGCRNGWVLVVTSVDEEGGASVVSVVADLKEALALLDAGQLTAVAVDLPIGLPESGPQTCYVAARHLLGPRRSSVFPAPPRCTLGSATYHEACAWSRAVCGRAVSRQTFAIMAKVEALDHLMTPERQDSLIEVHPEVSFTGRSPVNRWSITRQPKRGKQNASQL